MKTQTRIEEAKTEQGCRKAFIAKSTGTLVMIIDDRQWQMCNETFRWVTLCEDHGGLCTHETLKDAQDWSTSPEQWCWVCQENA